MATDAARLGLYDESARDPEHLPPGRLMRQLLMALRDPQFVYDTEGRNDRDGRCGSAGRSEQLRALVSQRVDGKR